MRFFFAGVLGWGAAAGGGSKYRHYFKLKKEEGCPDSVVAFAQARCEKYTPHDVFVMDICLWGMSILLWSMEE